MVLLTLLGCKRAGEPELPPVAPSGVEATVEAQAVTLRWQTQATSQVAGYHVYRSSSQPVTLSSDSRLTGGPYQGDRYTDDGIPEPGTYYYVVTSVVASGLESAPSEAVEAVVEPPPVEPVEPPEPCVPHSSLPCSTLLVSLPYTVTWQDGEDIRAETLEDGAGVGTGFTMVDVPSSRLEADGPLSDPALPGYEPSKLSVDTQSGSLSLTTGAGIQYRDHATSGGNSLVNGLGVGVDASQGRLRLETTLLDPTFPLDEGYQQAGLWFGLDQDNYLKLVLINYGESMARVQLLREVEGQSSAAGDEVFSVPLALGEGSTVRFVMVLDPLVNEVRAAYRVNDEPEVSLGGFVGVPPAFFTGSSAGGEGTLPLSFAGIFATHRYGAEPLTFRFGEFAVREDSSSGDPGDGEPGDGDPGDGGFSERIAWTAAAALPFGRTEAQGTVAGGKLYVFGGYTSWRPYRTTRDAQVYDPVGNTWTRLAEMPEAWTHAGVVVDEAGENLYLAGGYVNPNTGSERSEITGTREILRYNIAENRWYRNALPPLPEPRGSGGFVRLGSNLHFFGGHNLDRVDQGNHWVLNLSEPAPAWRELAPLQNPRNHLGFAALDGSIYAIGGQYRYRERARTLRLVHRYDPLTNVWERVADLPVALSHHSSSTFVMGGRIFVVGGEYSHNNYANVVFAYDPAQNAWLRLTSLPERRNAAVAGFLWTDGVGAITSSSGGSFSKETYRGSFVP